MKIDSKGYNPKDIEEKYYKIWEEAGCFEVEGNKNIQKEGKRFCIMMPPSKCHGKPPYRSCAKLHSPRYSH